MNLFVPLAFETSGAFGFMAAAFFTDIIKLVMDQLEEAMVHSSVCPSKSQR